MASWANLPGVALITGSASGIGRAIAVSFGKAGCTKFALLDIDEAGLKETQSLIEAAVGDGKKDLEIQLHKCDISAADSVVSVFAAVKKHFTRLDYSVQCAACTAFPGLTTDVSLEMFDKHINISYRGLWLCSREAIRIMRDQSFDSEAYPNAKISPTRAQRGSVVNISSAIALYAQRNFGAYAGTKAGVIGLTRTDALDFADRQIRVNAVLPGLTDTPSTNQSTESRAWLEANSLRMTPIGRFADPEEIADVCTFLSSNRASFVTGASYVVDGGYSVGYL